MVCCMILNNPTASASTSEIRVVNKKSYRDCHVFDSVDLLTDEVDHWLFCKQRSIFSTPHSTPHLILLSFQTDDLTHQRREIIVFEIADQYSLRDWMDVSIRVDNGEVKKERWLGSHSAGVVNFGPGINSLLVEMVAGNHVAFQIRDKSGNINLEGTVSLNGFANAFTDYERRMAQYKK